jgi:prepilin-type N-terminal cleavage/methylation domain-containing protein
MTTASRVAKRAAARGLTLIELLAVIAIIGILAMIAVVMYGRWIRSSKTTEATNMIQKIRDAEERRKAETGKYLDISNGLTRSDLYPNDPGVPTPHTTAWGAQCNGCKSDWANLALQPDGPVQFGYALVAGDANTTPSSRGANVSVDGNAIAWPKPTGPWYVVVAMADFDGNGVYCTIVGSSFENRIYTDKEGE